MCPKRLLLFDLDETLLTRERRIHPTTLAVLQRLMDAGVLVSLSTGRSPRCTEPHASVLRPNAPLIHFNGAVIRDRESGERLLERVLPMGDALAALELGAAHGLHANLYIGDDILIAERTETSRESEVKDGVPHTVVGNLVQHLSRVGAPPIKILFIGEPTSFPAFSKELRPRLESECQLVNSEWNYLELLPEGVSKGAAVLDLARILGLEPEECIAFGDNKNDIEMLEACGLGVAMENAHPALLAVADRVIGSHDSDSIGRFLDEEFPPSD